MSVILIAAETVLEQRWWWYAELFSPVWNISGVLQSGRKGDTQLFSHAIPPMHESWGLSGLPENNCICLLHQKKTFLPHFVFLRGADDLLPILTFVALRSEMPQLVSECAALEEFIHEGCVFNIKCCILFIFSASMNSKWAMGSCVELWEGPHFSVPYCACASHHAMSCDFLW